MPRSPSGAELRAWAIEVLLLWEGSVSRARLLELFSVHGTIASRDLASFRAAHPNACDHDLPSKSYVARPLLKPTLSRGEFSEYQRLIGAGGQTEELRAGVPVRSTHVDATRIDYRLFRQIHGAMRDGACVRIQYRSINTPVPHDRLIKPHALIQAGPRWHVRAWCAKAMAFRDFNLGRIAKVAHAVDASALGPEKDSAWQTEVKVRLVPHIGLTKDQADLVRDEYMGGTTALVHTVRVPMVRYLLQAFASAIDPAKESAPAHLLMVDQPQKLPEECFW